MQRKNNVHVVGTGTIGEPLIGILSVMKQQLGIDNVTYHKNSARVIDRAKLYALQQKGAMLAATPETDAVWQEPAAPTGETEEA